MDLFFAEAIESLPILDAGESHHVVRVLRKKSGDRVHVTDGKGTLFTCHITDPNPRKCGIEIVSLATFPPLSPKIHIAIAPTKSVDRINWFIEKAVEIGVNRITLMTTEHTERTRINSDKVRQKAISAMKQSLQYWLPQIDEETGLKKLLQENAGQKFIAHLSPGHSVELTSVIGQGEDAMILIGPEGDFSSSEIDASLKSSFQMVSLGETRLRTETAGVVAATLLRSSL